MQSVDAQIFARGVFDAMPEKNVVCWTSMVSAYVNSGCSDEARALFERSPVKDRFLWTTMINGYVQYNNVDEAMILFRCMQRDRVKAWQAYIRSWSSMDAWYVYNNNKIRLLSSEVSRIRQTIETDVL